MTRPLPGPNHKEDVSPGVVEEHEVSFLGSSPSLCLSFTWKFFTSRKQRKPNRKEVEESAWQKSRRCMYAGVCTLCQVVEGCTTCFDCPCLAEEVQLLRFVGMAKRILSSSWEIKHGGGRERVLIVFLFTPLLPTPCWPDERASRILEALRRRRESRLRVLRKGREREMC